MIWTVVGVLVYEFLGYLTAKNYLNINARYDFNFVEKMLIIIMCMAIWPAFWAYEFVNYLRD